MKIFTGRSERQVRADIQTVALRKEISIEQLFKYAAKKYAPALKPGCIKRKLDRYEKGSAAPDFVKKYVLDTLMARPSVVERNSSRAFSPAS